MKQLFVGSHPNTVRFSDLDGRDRICEIRAMIADAYRMLRDSIGEQAKNETNTFHGPWLVFRNLMNDHPAACLEEFRHASIYFDADTEGKVTEIADLIEQHIELTRQSISLKGANQHQADAMVGIASTGGRIETTVMQGLGKTRRSLREDHQHRILADKVKGYMNSVSGKQSLFEFCTLLTKRFGPSTFEDFSDNTEEEMFQTTWEALVTTKESLEAVRDAVHKAILTFELPGTQAFVAWEDRKPTIKDDQDAGDENFAFSG